MRKKEPGSFATIGVTSLRGDVWEERKVGKKMMGRGKFSLPSENKLGRETGRVMEKLFPLRAKWGMIGVGTHTARVQGPIRATQKKKASQWKGRGCFGWALRRGEGGGGRHFCLKVGITRDFAREKCLRKGRTLKEWNIWV